MHSGTLPESARSALHDGIPLCICRPASRGAQGGRLIATSYADMGLRVARLAGEGRFVGVMHVFERAEAPPS